MGNEVELVSDGNGLAVIGSASDVERFLEAHGLAEHTGRPIDFRRMGSAVGAGGVTAQIMGDFSQNSGRWIKLTKESAENVRKFGLMPTKTPGVSHAMIGNPGDIKKWLQVAQAPGALLTGPMMLPMLASVMSQQAMQQQMDELKAYLELIDEKLDDIIRAQKDAVLAEMIGVDLTIEEALTVRDSVGRVSEVTWSKVQVASMTLAKTQAYAIRQLDAFADKLVLKGDPGDVAKAAGEIEPKVREWLAVIARTFQLSDAVSILELDRVLDAAPHELDRHRLGLESARRNRIDLVSRTVTRLLARIDESIQFANSKVLTNPIDSPALVRASNSIASKLVEFGEHMRIHVGREIEDAKRWRSAAAETRDKVITAGAGGAAAVKRFGGTAANRTSELFRAVDVDGDGVPDQPRAAAAAQEAGDAIKGAAVGIAGAFGTLFHKKRSDSAGKDASKEMHD